MNDLVFKRITTCSNPMEVEIFPATLRERDIPHRTEWGAGGTLTILVPEEWEAEAIEALDSAAKIFFKEEFKPAQGCQAVEKKVADKPDDNENVQTTEKSDPANKPAGQPELEPDPTHTNGSPEDQGPAKVETNPEDEQEMDFGRWSFFDRDGLPAPEETKIRRVWPAWALAALPGTGLGHLYAGKFQMFLYLVFLSVIGVLFFEYTQSYFAFILNVFSWSMDLGFAALHVKEHNRKAIRNKLIVKKAEQDFIDSI